MKRRDWVPIAVGVLLVTAVAVIGWLAYSRAERQVREGRTEEDPNVARAKTDMQVIEQAVKKYYTEHGEWPPHDNLRVLAPELERGQNSLLDPWGNPYVLQIVEYQDETTGEIKQRPLLICQPPGGKPPIQWPTR